MGALPCTFRGYFQWGDGPWPSALGLAPSHPPTPLALSTTLQDNYLSLVTQCKGVKLNSHWLSLIAFFRLIRLQIKLEHLACGAGGREAFYVWVCECVRERVCVCMCRCICLKLLLPWYVGFYLYVLLRPCSFSDEPGFLFELYSEDDSWSWFSRVRPGPVCPEEAAQLRGRITTSCHENATMVEAQAAIATTCSQDRPTFVRLRKLTCSTYNDISVSQSKQPKLSKTCLCTFSLHTTRIIAISQWFTKEHNQV